MAKRIFTDESLSTLVDNIKSYTDNAASTRATANHGIYYGTCDSSASSIIKTVALTDATGFSLVEGTVVIVKFKYSNSATNPRMNVNTTGAKYMKRQGTIAIPASSASYGWQVGAVQIFVYDGENWVRDYWYNSTYSNFSLGHGHGTCDTEEATLEKVVTTTGLTAVTGGFLAIKFANAVPANSTLKINSSDSRAIYHNGVAITDGVIRAGDTATFVYDDEIFHLVAINRDAYSKADHELTLIYDSGEIAEAVNSIAGIDISGYNNIHILAQNVNDGTNTTSGMSGIVFTATNGTAYLFPAWSGFFHANSGKNTCGMAHFKLMNGWLAMEHGACSAAQAKDVFDETEGGSALKCSVHGGGAFMRCTNELSTMALTSSTQSESLYLGVGSRVMVWGCKV